MLIEISIKLIFHVLISTFGQLKKCTKNWYIVLIKITTKIKKEVKKRKMTKIKWKLSEALRDKRADSKTYRGLIIPSWAIFVAINNFSASKNTRQKNLGKGENEETITRPNFKLRLSIHIFQIQAKDPDWRFEFKML